MKAQFVLAAGVLITGLAAVVLYINAKRRPPFDREAYRQRLMQPVDALEQERIATRVRQAFESGQPYWIHRSGGTPDLARQYLRQELERQRPFFPPDLDILSISVEVPDDPYKGLYDSGLKIEFRSRLSVS